MLSWRDYGEEVAVGRNGEIAEAKAVEDGKGLRLRYGNGLSCGYGGERGKIDPNEIAGFLFDGTLEEEARFVGRPAKHA